MGEKKQHYDDAMIMWKCRLNPAGPRQLAIPPQRLQFTQSTNNLPELYNKDSTVMTLKPDIGQSVNLRSHSDIRYHLNVFESSYYLDKKRTEAYRRELDEQIKERNRRKMLEKQMSNGVELAPLLLKSPSLPKLPYLNSTDVHVKNLGNPLALNSTDVTKNLNFSPRLDVSSTIFSPQNYHQELSSQQQFRRSTENDQRERDKEETVVQNSDEKPSFHLH